MALAHRYFFVTFFLEFFGFKNLSVFLQGCLFDVLFSVNKLLLYNLVFHDFPRIFWSSKNVFRLSSFFVVFKTRLNRTTVAVFSFQRVNSDNTVLFFGFSQNFLSINKGKNRHFFVFLAIFRIIVPAQKREHLHVFF